MKAPDGWRPLASFAAARPLKEGTRFLCKWPARDGGWSVATVRGPYTGRSKKCTHWVKYATETVLRSARLVAADYSALEDAPDFSWVVIVKAQQKKRRK